MLRQISNSILLVCAFLAISALARAGSTSLVISQVYGAGGQTGATYQNDFIEIFNLSASTVSVAGWSVQYTSSGGTVWQVTNLSGSIPAGGYYLVQESSTGPVGTPMPTPDASGTIAMAGTGGKVALVNSTTALSGACPAGPSIVDFIGYNATANCYETAAAPAVSNVLSDQRAGGGCTDSDNNSSDFSQGTPLPRNSASALNPCSGGSTPPTGACAASPSTLSEGQNTLLTVQVTPGTNPASTGIAVQADLTQIGGIMAQTFFDDGTNGDVTLGDNIFSFQATVAMSTSPGLKTLPVTISDAEARSSNPSISLTVVAPASTPTPSPTMTVTPFLSPSFSSTHTPAMADTQTGTPSPTLTESPPLASETASPTGSATPSATPSITDTFSPSSTRSPSPADSPTESGTPTPTLSDTPSSTATAPPSGTPSWTATFSGTPSPSLSPSPGWSESPTRTPTPGAAFPVSGLGRALVGPLPAREGQALCLHLNGQPARSSLEIYNSAGQTAARFSFGTEARPCWKVGGLAKGFYFAWISVLYADGRREERVQKLAVLP